MDAMPHPLVCPRVRSMQAKLDIRVAKVGYSGQRAGGDLYGMDRGFDIQPPMLEEAAQAGKFRDDVVSLPDEALQEIGMVGHAVKDLGCGHAAFKQNNWLNRHKATPLVASEESLG